MIGSDRVEQSRTEYDRIPVGYFFFLKIELNQWCWSMMLVDDAGR